jgi:hypothetical protein
MIARIDHMREGTMATEAAQTGTPVAVGARTGIVRMDG